MKQDRLVSVIVPVYNVEKYLGKCIESIVQQTYRSLEIIIVDDGSPDHSPEIAERYARRDKRIRVIHQPNKGVAAARNSGMDEAEGEYITFVDSDDWIAPDYVEHLMMLQQAKDADMCMTTKLFTKKRDTQDKIGRIETLSPEDAAAMLLSPKVVVGTYNKLYRREWLVKNNIWQDERLFSGEGLHFIVTAAQHANYVTVSNRRIYYYRRNVSESATTKFNIKMFTNNELSLDLIRDNKIVSSKKFDVMLDLFREHLMINGLMAILTYSTPDQYPEEYARWKEQICNLGKKLLIMAEVPIKSKVRIICANFAPHLWSMLAKIKRQIIFKRSV